MELSLIDIALALSSALIAVVGTTFLLRRLPVPVDEHPSPQDEPLSLLFEDGMLHHATTRAASQFALLPGKAIWADLRDALINRFPDFPEHANTGQQGQITIRATDNANPREALISWRGPLCWVDLPNGETLDKAQTDPQDVQELEFLRRFSDTSSNPSWQENTKGEVLWHNDAYGSLHRLIHGAASAPNLPLFDFDRTAMPSRVSITAELGDPPDYYGLSMVEQDGTTTYHATCINALVEAEQTQKSFVQTLAKTFAHLSIGLAIFDRNGQLSIFNPALVDLTGLPVRTLSTRPTMISFFDQLRENRRMPEPKNYRTWRQDLTEMISAATDGRYQETWTLESGQTYSVTGRPHPDGATAFLIEDKSAEITLTRSFRAELEQAQEMIDGLEDAIVVFSTSGVLTFCNAAYRTLWRVEPETTFADVTIRDSVKVWRGETASNGTSLAAVESYVIDTADRAPVDFEMKLHDGSQLHCQMSTMAHGAAMVRFSQTDPAPNAPPVVEAAQ